MAHKTNNTKREQRKKWKGLHPEGRKKWSAERKRIKREKQEIKHLIR